MPRAKSRQPRSSLPSPGDSGAETELSLANRLFFRLYQCANMLHKTGTRAVEDHGLTTQQWAVLGAVSRPEAEQGMGVNELARYLMVSRQNLSGLLARMARAGHVRFDSAEQDRRSRLVRMTPSGRQLWQSQALPKIHAYYAQALEGFSINDRVHALHYLLRMLENMQRIDAREPEEAAADEAAEVGKAGAAKHRAGARRAPGSGRGAPRPGSQ